MSMFSNGHRDILPRATNPCTQGFVIVSARVGKEKRRTGRGYGDITTKRHDIHWALIALNASGWNDSENP